MSRFNFTSSSLRSYSPNEIASYFDVHWNYPTPGVCFRDMTRFLRNIDVRNFTFNQLTKTIDGYRASLSSTTRFTMLGIDSRGYIIGTPLSDRCGMNFGRVAKKGKLPGENGMRGYRCEYGKNELEIRPGTVEQGEYVIIADDLLATGGSALAAAELAVEQGGIIFGFIFFGKSELPEDAEAKLKTVYPDAFIIYACDFKNPENPDSALTSRLLNYNKVIFSTEEEIKAADYLLVAHPSMYPSVKTLMTQFPKMFALLKVEWGYFPDGMPDIKFPYRSLKNRKIIYLMSSDIKEILLEQLALMRVLPKHEADKVFFWVPYFSVGTHERTTTPGVIATAEILMKLYSAGMPSAAGGQPQLVVGDIHAIVERHYVTNEVQFKNIEPLPLLVKLITMIKALHMTVIMPDDGALKRCKEILKQLGIPVLVFDKDRDGSNREVAFNLGKSLNIPKQDSPEFKEFFAKLLANDCIVLDDICHSGGTLVAVGRSLQKMGFRSVSAYVTHGVFPQDSYKRFLPGGPDNIFHTFYVTDSVTTSLPKLMKAGAPFYIIPFMREFVLDRIDGDILKTPIQKIFVRLNSTNKVKDTAVVQSLSLSFPTCDFAKDLRNADSGIDNQPQGKNDALKGLFNRHFGRPLKEILMISEEKETTEDLIRRQFGNNLKDLVDKFSIIFNISIENTLMKKNNKYYCVPFIMMDKITNYGKTLTRTIDSGDWVEVPEEFVEQSKASGWVIEVGKFIADKYKVNPSDWHSLYNPKTRCQILTELLIRMAIYN